MASLTPWSGDFFEWGFLSFLASPWFVIPWYAIGIAGMFLVIYDIRAHNSPLKAAIAWAWPIIVLFFSVIGLALYYGTARAPGIGRLKGEEARKAHDAYEENMLRRVNGAVIHCVAGSSENGAVDKGRKAEPVARRRTRWVEDGGRSTVQAPRG